MRVQGVSGAAAERRAKALVQVVLLLSFSFVASPAARAALSRAEAHQLLAEASERFRAAAASLESDRDKARREFEASIACYERLVDEGGVRNGRVYYNVGNAYLLMGDVGRAILNYRRAERLIPTDPNLRANLAEARRRVPNRIESTAQSRVRRVLLFWHEQTPARLRFAVFGGAYCLAWLWSAARTARLLAWGSWWPVAASAVVAGASLASLLFEQRERASAVDAVIVAPQTIGRKGPDARAYQPSFTEPLHAGVEVRLVERRPGWVLARLSDGRETWIEASAVEPVLADPGG